MRGTGDDGRAACPPSPRGAWSSYGCLARRDPGAAARRALAARRLQDVQRLAALSLCRSMCAAASLGCRTPTATAAGSRLHTCILTRPRPVSSLLGSFLPRDQIRRRPFCRERLGRGRRTLRQLLLDGGRQPATRHRQSESSALCPPPSDLGTLPSCPQTWALCPLALRPGHFALRPQSSGHSKRPCLRYDRGWHRADRRACMPKHAQGHDTWG